jgi:hypothetical protein
MAHGRPLSRVAAFYDGSSNRIYLQEGHPVHGPGLFHELVHFLQDINEKDVLFSNHRICLEAEAYDLQLAWQTENGIDPASRPEFGFVMTLYGACNDADFSWQKGQYPDAN